jgi:hypothetical protein
MYLVSIDQKEGIDGAGFGRLSLGQLSNTGEDTILAGTGAAAGTGDQTYMTQDDDDAELLQRKPTKPATAAAKPPLKSALKRTNVEAEGASKAAASAAPAKGRITLAEKKKREAKAAEIIETLPLEYRGSDAVSFPPHCTECDR